ncbi:MAG: ribulose-phosphate 3-epimerase [Cytophagales bacterium]|nr:MAG: ribulose-phosphate 3-epimerase [Cytophagales bacterium]
MIVSPSLLAADFANLQRDVEMLNASVADWIHVDIMDGNFVPNISFGLPVCEAVAKHAKKPLDVHLMIVNPEKYLESFKKAGAAHISVHIEACPHLHRTIQQIKELGCKAGVALNPHTPISQLEDIISDLDLVILMSVNPGFGGQRFIHQSLEKTEKLKNLILQKNTKTLIEIDGGVNLETGKLLKNAGADALVAGNFVFSSQSPIDVIKLLKVV